MSLVLYVIVDADSQPISETCLCTNCYSDYNKNWHEMNHANPIWLEFDPDDEQSRIEAREQEILEQTNKRKILDKLACSVCGYPINEIYDN